jgi:ribosomal 30S subunit maturation factor RimM
VEIYERSGKIYGKIVDIVDAEKRKVCVLHALARKKNKPVMGLVIIKGLKRR